MSATTVEIPLDVDLDNRPQTLLSYPNNLNSIYGIVGAVSINSVTDEGFQCLRPPFQYLAPIAGNPNGLFAASPAEQYTIEGSTLNYNGTALSTSLVNTPYDFAASPLPLNVMFRSAGAAYYRNGATFAKITDPNYPIATIPGCVCLDGTYYVMDGNSAIWGSANLNDASTWSALNRINAWQDRSAPVKLIQHRSYVVALKASSMQVFYDAGNPVGSPLLPLLAAQQPVGCLEASTVQDIHGDTFWVGQMKEVGVFVVQMSNLVISLISTSAINRWLEAQYKLDLSFFSTQVSIYGRSFYVLQPSIGGPAAVYDIEAKKWKFWDSPLGTFSSVAYSALCYNALFQAYPDTLYQTPTGYFRFIDSPTLNTHVPVQGVPVQWYDTNAAGATKAPIFQITTPIIDGGSMVEKTAMRLDIFSDNRDNGMLEVSWSDDDYKTWSGFVSMPLTSPRAFINDLGSFYRRAFRFRHIGTTPLRIQRAVLTVLPGSA